MELEIPVNFYSRLISEEDLRKFSYKNKADIPENSPLYTKYFYIITSIPWKRLYRYHTNEKQQQGARSKIQTVSCHFLTGRPQCEAILAITDWNHDYSSYDIYFLITDSKWRTYEELVINNHLGLIAGYSKQPTEDILDQLNDIINHEDDPYILHIQKDQLDECQDYQ